ncbi:unnamed protein product [Prunus armeniaca]|nr:unnamed protein product [Prunus armeniaca]
MQFIFPEVKLKEAANTCFHHHLEVVEIVGYRGHQMDESDAEVEEEDARQQPLHELKREVHAAISFECL